MTETIVRGAIGTAGSLLGGLLASGAVRKARKSITESKALNDAWHSRMMGEDATQRADAQRALTRMEQALRDRNRAASATQAVVGGTDAAVAASKASAANATAEAAAQIAANADARKDNIDREWRRRDQHLREALQQLDLSRANAIIRASKNLTATSFQL